jgi:hypothetical protein
MLHVLLGQLIVSHCECAVRGDLLSIPVEA